MPPIDYSLYPVNWKSEIRPRILARANNTCEFEGCDFKHEQIIFRTKVKGVIIWYEHRLHAIANGDSAASFKPIRVILTIAHLKHNETDHNVPDSDLAAFCQLHHLRFDSKEKQRRRNEAKL